MKHFLLTLFVALCSINIAAQGSGSACNDAIFVDTAYTASLTAGDYWFTASTHSLPLRVYIYVEDTTMQAPELYLDLTCTPGVYDDPNVAKMIQTAGEYFDGNMFPMKDVPKKYYDNDSNVYYAISYDENYRNMIYEQGVTYSIPAYLHLFLSSNATIRVVSESIDAQCRDYTNNLTMNTTLKLAPADSLNVYVWPIGDWIEKKYQITWNGEKGLYLFDYKDCSVDKDHNSYSYYLPIDEIVVDKTLASSRINSDRTTFLYLRPFPQSEGSLSIREIVEQSEITSYVVAGVNAVIDNESNPKTIKATLPIGTNRTTAIRKAEVTYKAYNGESITYDLRCTKLTFGDITYDLSGIQVAKANGNPDATLQTILIDGDTLFGFSSSVPKYENVETTNQTPMVTAVATSSTATIAIEQATQVPGMCVITVTPEVGEPQKYTLEFIKTRSRNANLKSIKVDGFLLNGFNASELNYRMEVSALPIVEAIAEDTLTTVTISQAKQVPGVALIYVTAEAGNVNTYSINFSVDNSLKECFSNSDTVAIDEQFELLPTSDLVLRLPAGLWKNDYIRFNWSNRKSPLTVYFSTTCEFTPSSTDTKVIDSVALIVPKGKENYEYNLRPADLQRLAKRSVDGNIYIRFSNAQSGIFTVTNWVETCVTRGLLIEPGDEVTLAGNSHTTIYKLYISEFKDKDMRLIWQGNDKLTSYFAETCDFNLTSTNRHVLKPSPFNFAAGKDSIDVNTATWTNWAASEDEGFIYVRFVNKQTGTLTFKVLKDYNPQSPTGVENAWSPLADNLRVVAEQGSLLIRSFVAQPVGVYTLDGMCVAQLTMQADEQIALTLPAGLYIVRGDTAALKAVVR